MIVLEQTRRATRAAAERVRQALIELDEMFQSYQVFETDLSAEDAYAVVRDTNGWVVVVTDPTLA